MKKIWGFVLLAWLAAVAGAQTQGRGGASGGSSAGDARGALSEMDRAFENPDEELTPEDEYYLGRAVAAQILKNYTLYSRNSAMISYLDKICQAVAINSSQPSLFNGYHVGILNTREINAFATPGGHIFITMGLLECADSEDALAAVIAHELAHIQLRHAARIIEDQQLASELSQVSGRAATMAARNANSQQRAALFNRSISAMVTTLFKNGFAQDQEFDADIAAVKLLRDAGYDPAAMLGMLRLLETAQPKTAGGFNTTHPSPAARIANVQKVSLAGRANTRSARNARFAAFQKLLKAAP
ncbi:MAG: M48 family metalloprotease [Treponema sp.]|nr:M48 family metalloprotease [Treponema sp.]